MQRSTAPLLRFLVIGQLRRDFILTSAKRPEIDILGGSLVHAASGIGVWETGIGLVGRAGEDFSQNWISQIEHQGFDIRGIRILPESIDTRAFYSYANDDRAQTNNPMSHFAALKLPFPKALLGYSAAIPQIDSRNQPTWGTIRVGDVPEDYVDATAVHLCPLDFLSHSLLPPHLRNGNISTITIDPSYGYMDPIFWDDIPLIVSQITAFLPNEEKIRSLFHGRSQDLWEMAEALAGYGCDIIVIKRGKEGQYLYDHTNHSKWSIPAYPIKQVLDPTGAGSAFCGGFIAGYHNTLDPLEAVLYGNISASMTVESCGAFYALDALPRLSQARLEALHSAVQKI